MATLAGAVRAFLSVARSLAVLGILTASLVLRVEAADTYPQRAITMVVPFAPGGPTDTLARILGENLEHRLGQRVVVENVTGAGGTIALGRVARAHADGYTIVLGAWNTHVVNGAIYKLDYDLLDDFAPVGLVANNHTMIVSNPQVPAKTLAELISWLRDNQDHVSVATGGVGTSAHIAAVFFEVATGIRFQLVPYRGSAPAEQELVAGHVDLMFDQASSALQYVRSGATRAYAVAAPRRLAADPEIPTTDEAGLADFHISVWHALWAPKGTPPNVIETLNAALRGALGDPALRERLAQISQEVPADAQQTPAALRALHQAEIAKWWPIIKAANIAVQ